MSLLFSGKVLVGHFYRKVFEGIFWWKMFCEHFLNFGGNLVEYFWWVFWADQMWGFYSCHSLSLPSSSEEEWRLDDHHPQPISAPSPVSIPHSTLPTPLPLPSPPHLTSSYLGVFWMPKRLYCNYQLDMYGYPLPPLHVASPKKLSPHPTPLPLILCNGSLSEYPSGFLYIAISVSNHLNTCIYFLATNKHQGMGMATYVICLKADRPDQIMLDFKSYFCWKQFCAFDCICSR